MAAAPCVGGGGGGEGWWLWWSCGSCGVDGARGNGQSRLSSDFSDYTFLPLYTYRDL